MLQKKTPLLGPSMGKLCFHKLPYSPGGRQCGHRIVFGIPGGPHRRIARINVIPRKKRAFVADLLKRLLAVMAHRTKLVEVMNLLEGKPIGDNVCLQVLFCSLLTMKTKRSKKALLVLKILLGKQVILICFRKPLVNDGLINYRVPFLVSRCPG